MKLASPSPTMRERPDALPDRRWSQDVLVRTMDSTEPWLLFGAAMGPTRELCSMRCELMCAAINKLDVPAEYETNGDQKTG